MLPCVGLEVRRVAPELILMEWFCVMEAYYERGIDLVQETGEMITHQHGWGAHLLWPFAPVVAGEYQQVPLFGRLPQAQASFHERLVSGQEYEPFFVCL